MKRLPLVFGAVVLVALTVWAFTPTRFEQVTDPGLRVAASEAYNPVAAGEPLPAGFRQLLPRDAIAPVYEPVFTTADQVSWHGESQVIGVAVGDEAKAYPVSFLNRCEMVLDEIAGDAILVTW